MSDMAVPMAGHEPRRTWRDAVTPSTRASRRRWALAYALLLCFGGVYVAAFATEDSGAGALVTAGLFVVFGMLRRGTRRLTAFDHPELDERDLLARDRAFRLAYPILLVVLLASLVAFAFALPDAERREAVQGGFSITSGSFVELEALIGLALWLALWAIFLPTGVLAWREPDALPADAGEPAFGISEIARDTLLAAALAGGLVLGLLQEDALVSLLPLVAVLMLLGAVARRAAGQPPVRAGTVLRFAAGLVLVVAILAALFYSIGAVDSP